MNSRKLCPACEATPTSCDTRRHLSGRDCCDACTGEHSTTHAPTAARFSARVANDA